MPAKKYENGKTRRKLPFPSKSFDVVVCVDTLEHVSEITREQIIDEMIRVSKSRTYLAYPRGEIARACDTILSHYYRFTHKQPLAFLDEHARYGLPKDKIIAGHIHKSLQHNNQTASVSHIGNTNSFLWLFMLLLGFSENAWLTSVYKILPLTTPLLSKINFFPTYRSLWTLKFQ